EHSTNLLRRRRQMAVLRRPEHLDWRAINRLVHPDIGKVQAQHTEQYVEQRPDNLGRLVATPNGRQGEDTDQIIEAALQAHDLIHCLLHLLFHPQYLMVLTHSTLPGVRAAAAGTHPAGQKMGSTGAPPW